MVGGAGELWPESANALPDPLSSPAVAFEDDQILLAATVRRSVIRSVVSTAVNASGGRDSWLIRVEQFSTGAISWSAETVAGFADQWLVDVVKWNKSTDQAFTGGDNPLRQISSVSDLKRGVTVSNRFYWSNGGRHFSVRDVSIDNGAMTLSIEPLP